jgi:hypothetical protein
VPPEAPPGRQESGMTRIVTTHYRYKRPTRKRKPVEIEGPAVVTTKSSRRPVRGTEEAAAEVRLHAPVPRGEGAVQPSTPRETARVAPPANDDRKPAIVAATGRKRQSDADYEAATAGARAFIERALRAGGAS